MANGKKNGKDVLEPPDQQEADKGHVEDPAQQELSAGEKAHAEVSAQAEEEEKDFVGLLHERAQDVLNEVEGGPQHEALQHATRELRKVVRALTHEHPERFPEKNKPARF